MWKITGFLVLMILYLGYSGLVYTTGTANSLQFSAAELVRINKGKSLFQQYNCIACHQLYGLGGYLGPDLTTAHSDPARGELYMKIFLQAGGARMQKYAFTEEEINSIVSFLKYVDSTAITYKKR